MTRCSRRSVQLLIEVGVESAFSVLASQDSAELSVARQRLIGYRSPSLVCAPCIGEEIVAPLCGDPSVDLGDK